jgi:hypothetical protein
LERETPGISRAQWAICQAALLVFYWLGDFSGGFFFLDQPMKTNGDMLRMTGSESIQHCLGFGIS